MFAAHLLCARQWSKYAHIYKPFNLSFWEFATFSQLVGSWWFGLITGLYCLQSVRPGTALLADKKKYKRRRKLVPNEFQDVLKTES